MSLFGSQTRSPRMAPKKAPLIGAECCQNSIQTQTTPYPQTGQHPKTKTLSLDWRGWPKAGACLPGGRRHGRQDGSSLPKQQTTPQTKLHQLTVLPVLPQSCGSVPQEGHILMVLVARLPLITKIAVSQFDLWR